jgi:hypothetical protein
VKFLSEFDIFAVALSATASEQFLISTCGVLAIPCHHCPTTPFCFGRRALAERRGPNNLTLPENCQLLTDLFD